MFGGGVPIKHNGHFLCNQLPAVETFLPGCLIAAVMDAGGSFARGFITGAEGDPTGATAAAGAVATTADKERKVKKHSLFLNGYFYALPGGAAPVGRGRGEVGRAMPEPVGEAVVPVAGGGIAATAGAPWKNEC